MSKVFKKLKPSDISIQPFRAYKTWNSSEDDYLNENVAILKARWTLPTLAISASSANNAPTNQDGSFQEVIWESTKHLYYHEEQNPAYQFGPTSKYNTKKELFASASVISLPYQRVGEGVKPGSVNIIDAKDEPSSNLIIRDDSFGNLYDVGVDTGSFIAHTYCSLYLGFNDKFNVVTYYNELTSSLAGTVKDGSYNKTNADYKNIMFPKGIELEATASATGNAARFNGTNSNIRLDNTKYINPKRDEDFALTLWANNSTTSSTEEWLVSKEGEKTVEQYNPTTGLKEFVTQSYTDVVYPYRMTVQNGYVTASVYDGDTQVNLYSSASVGTDYNFLALNKSGSIYQLWVGDTMHDAVTASLDLKVHNTSNLYIGSKDQASGFYAGDIDELRFWSKGLTTNELGSLATLTYHNPGAYNSAIIGNVMYEHGMLVVSSPLPKYQEVLMGNGEWDYTSGRGFQLTWKSTQTIYEYETTCTVRKGEYNATLNPSAIMNGDSYLYKNNVTGSEWHPYVSTVGLYDDYGQLLAVGKLSRPIPKRDDIDISFVVRFDV